MRVVITGAAGRIGSEMVDELAQAHELRLIDRVPMAGHDSIVADLAEARDRNLLKRWSKSSTPRWMRAFEAVDAVLHLAANPSPQASWQNVLRNNIGATWNVCEAATKYNVPRVVFASSNYAVKASELALASACYTPSGPKIGSDCEPCPLTPYGISKAAGEVIGQTFVGERKLQSFVAVRIGSFNQMPPKDPTWRNLWISPGDIRSLLQRCIEAQFSGFHVVYGVSAQPTSPYDLSKTCNLLSWRPSDDIHSQSCDNNASYLSDPKNRVDFQNVFQKMPYLRKDKLG